jgi:hypothetical protein
MKETKVENMNVEQLILAMLNISLIIEKVENLLKEKGEIPYDLESITVGYNGDEKTMGVLHKQLLEMQYELSDRLMTHKMEPYIGTEHEEFISKVAAAMLENADILEDRIRTEFEDEIANMMKRYKELNVFFVKQKPRNLVINRLKEALECYVHGYFQGCAILCRATLETALREKMKAKIGREPNKSKTLGPLLEDAMKLGIISRDDKLANKVKSIGNESAHDSKRCSPSEAFESLTNTKLLLNILYQKN